jgi:signal recognition particle receptor subunit beta
MSEHVILFGGPMGAGKTTAIRSLSDIDVVSTEAANSDRETVDKPTTTVALDYGEILLGPDEKVRLYGIPGQRRFSFMWRMLADRAEGMLLLVADDGVDPVGELLMFLHDFADLAERGGVVVGVSRTDLGRGPGMAAYAEALTTARPDTLIPVLSLDPRDKSQMRMALMTLVVNLEMRAMFAVEGSPA